MGAVNYSQLLMPSSRHFLTLAELWRLTAGLRMHNLANVEVLFVLLKESLPASDVLRHSVGVQTTDIPGQISLETAG